MKTVGVRPRKRRAALRCGEPTTNERDTVLAGRLATGQAPPDAAPSARLRRPEGSAPLAPRRRSPRRTSYERREAMYGHRELDRAHLPQGRGDRGERMHGPRRGARPEEEPA